MDLHVARVAKEADYELVFRRMVNARAGGLFVIPNPQNPTYRAAIIEFAARTRIPTLYGVKALGLTIPQSLLLRADEVTQ